MFFLVNLLVSSFYLDSWRNPNTTSRVLQVRSLLEDGKLNIDKFHEETIDKSFVNGHYYSDKAPFPSFLVYALYAIPDKIGLTPDSRSDGGEFIFIFSSFLTGSVCFSLIILLVFKRLLLYNFSIAHAAFLSTIPFYGSMFFIYAGTFYAHLFVVLLILLSFMRIKKDRVYFQAGLLSGAAFFSEYLTAVIFFIWFFFIWNNKSFVKSILYALGILPFILAFFWYNYSLTGNIFETAYAHQVYYNLEHGGFSVPSLRTLFMLLFSTQKGLIFYVPVFLVFLPLLKQVKWKDLKNIKSDLVLLPVLFFLLALISFSEWSGGWTFGPRYLFPATGLLLFVLLPRLRFTEQKSLWIYIPLGFGLIYAMMTKITILYSIPSDSDFPLIQIIIPNLLNGHFNDGSMTERLSILNSANSALLFVFLFFSALLFIYYLCKKEISANN